ncbi:MAG: amidohydrolase family protein [Spirochaetales bacterium]|nr:amidohydrolase family protein [Spirochaetales bacterium]
MKILRTAFLLLVGLSYGFLLLWAFQDIRIGIRLKVMEWMGLGRSSPAFVDEFVPVTDFDPQPVLVQSATELAALPYPIVEIHGHVFRSTAETLKLGLDELNIEIFVNLALRTTNRKAFEELRVEYSDPRVLHFPGLNFQHLKRDDFAAIAADLEEIAKAYPVKGIKVWKNFGLLERTANGERLRMDDDRLQPVWDVVRRHKLIVAMHTADPPAFWQAADRRNERLPELIRFPERALPPDALPFADVLAERERLFAKQKDIVFIAQHSGELAHDLTEADRLLSNNPNVYLDIAQRIDELGRQPRRTRAFFLRHHKRLLFGMDGAPDKAKFEIYRRFLETEDEYFDYHPPGKRKSFWKIHGLGLPASVLRDIYRDNALRLLQRTP